MGTYMIPRDTKGEGRILFIFSTKALIYTVVGALVGWPFYYIFKLFKFDTVGIVIMITIALIGFAIGTFKFPKAEGIKISKYVGGEDIDDLILRYIKFKRKKNKIYITKEEEN